jgi:ketosteroid isomerase-like protein
MSELSETQRANVELVRSTIDAFGHGPDSEELLALMDPDIEIFVPVEYPNAGTFHGRDGYLAWVDRWLEAWEGFSVELVRVVPLGERHVAMLAHQTATGLGSGIPVEMEIGYMFEIRAEAVAAMHLYGTVDEAVTVAEQRERESPD